MTSSYLAHAVSIRRPLSDCYLNAQTADGGVQLYDWLYRSISW